MKSMDHVSVNINIMQGNLRPVYVYEFHKAHDLSLSLSLPLPSLLYRPIKYDGKNWNLTQITCSMYTILLLWILTSRLVH